MSLTHIETIELGSSQASITFSSIPQDYDDLVVLISARSSRAATVDGCEVTLNGSSSNISTVRLEGTGSAAASSTRTDAELGFLPGSSATSNTFSNNKVYISNYASSNNKSRSSDSVIENNATSSNMAIYASLWSDTSAVTSVEVAAASGNLEANSVFSLYGVTAGGDGTVSTA